MTSDNVRSIQGEQQGELLPNRQVKFSDIGMSDTGPLLKRGDTVEFSGTGVVIASYPKTFKGGTRNIVEIGDVDVDLDKVTTPEEDPSMIDDSGNIRDDAAEG